MPDGLKKIPSSISLQPLEVSHARNDRELYEIAGDPQLSVDEAVQAFANPRYARLRQELCGKQPGRTCQHAGQFFTSILDYLQQRKGVQRFIAKAARDFAVLEREFIGATNLSKTIPAERAHETRSILARSWRHYSERVRLLAAYRPDVVADSFARLLTQPGMAGWTAYLRDLLIEVHAPLTVEQWRRIGGATDDPSLQQLAGKALAESATVTKEQLFTMARLLVRGVIQKDVLTQVAGRFIGNTAAGAELIGRTMLAMDDADTRLAAALIQPAPDLERMYLPAVLERLNDPSIAIRFVVVRALADNHDPKAIEGLLTATHDTESQIRLAAVKALAWVAYGDVRDRLEVLTKDADREVAAAAFSVWWETRWGEGDF